MRTVACLGLTALLLACCGRPAPTPGGTSAQTAGPSVSASADLPVASTDRPLPTPLPLPLGFPVIPGAEAEPGGLPTASTLAGWRSDAEPQEVYDFYLEALPSSGFTIELAAPGGGAAIIRFRRGAEPLYQLDLVGAGPVRLFLGPAHD